MIFQSNVTDRELVKNAKQALIGAGVSQIAFDNAVLSSSHLRLIQPLTAGPTLFTFPVLNTNTGSVLAVRPDETRLAQQNAFFIGKMWFSLFNSAGYNWVPKSYPSTQSFTTGAASLYAVYNGKLNITIDNSVVVRDYSMAKFLNIPNPQFTAATNSPNDAYDGTQMLPMEKNIVFGGLSDIVLTITLPASMATIDANTFGCWTFDGILAQNVQLGAIQ